MPAIAPDPSPVSAEDLAREAEAAGVEPDAPPLVEAQNADGAAEVVETGLTRLPPG